MLTIFETLIVHILSLYFIFFVLTRASWLARLRNWVASSWHPWVYKAIWGCPLCFGFHVSWLITLGIFIFTGTIVISTGAMLAAPVGLLILDQTVTALINYNSPPQITASAMTKKEISNR